MAKTLHQIKEKANNIDRKKEKGIVNEKTSSSISEKEDGSISLTSNKYCEYKQSPEGKMSSTSLESEETTNRKKINADEIMVNGHKLNSDFYELSDSHSHLDSVLRNLTVECSVLVRVWDDARENFVFIRRPMRAPLFFPKTNTSKIPEEIE